MYPLGARGSVGMPLGNSPVSLGAAAWWLSGGISAANCIAAYAPKGAASLAASYVNLAQPGTYNAAPGVAPGWDTLTGWDFDGLSQYLNSNVIPSGTHYTIIVKLDWDSGSGFVVGVRQTSRILIQPAFGMLTPAWYYPGIGVGGAATSSNAGSYALNNVAGYRDGVQNKELTGTTTPNFTKPIFIGAYNLDGSPTGYFNGRTSSVAIYNTTITPAQVAAVHAAMP